jgi:hypothetical protein
MIYCQISRLLLYVCVACLLVLGQSVINFDYVHYTLSQPVSGVNLENDAPVTEVASCPSVRLRNMIHCAKPFDFFLFNEALLSTDGSTIIDSVILLFFP